MKEGVAVELGFDRQFAIRLEELQARIIELGVPEVSVKRCAPAHLSLAVFDCEYEEQLSAVVAGFACGTKSFSLSFIAAGTFPSEEGVVFLQPLVNCELLQLQAELHRRLGPLSSKCHEYYQPGKWAPHCTVAINIPAAQVRDVSELCRTAPVFGAAQAVQIRLMEFFPTRELAAWPLA